MKVEYTIDCHIRIEDDEGDYRYVTLRANKGQDGTVIRIDPINLEDVDYVSKLMSFASTAQSLLHDEFTDKYHAYNQTRWAWDPQFDNCKDVT
jgi:hypothetical protein